MVVAGPEAGVFLVDDDEVVRDSFTMLLDAHGFTVMAFPSCKDFLDHWDGAAGNCLILDVHMAGMNGFDLLKLLRERRHPIPTILISGGADAAMRNEAVALGAVTLLHKPVPFPALLSAIHQALAPRTP